MDMGNGRVWKNFLFIVISAERSADKLCRVRWYWGTRLSIMLICHAPDAKAVSTAIHPFLVLFSGIENPARVCSVQRGMVLSFLLRYEVFRIKFIRPFVNGGLFLVIMNKGFVLREMISCDISAIFILTIPKMEDS